MSFRTTKAEAILLMKRQGSLTFNEILRTEAVDDTVNPSFIRKARFLPLIMRDSQSLAASSILQVDVLINSRVQFSTQFPLSQLLWEQKFTAKFKPYVYPYSIRRRTDRQGTVIVKVVRGRSVSTKLDGRKVQFFVKISAGLWSRLRERNIRIAVSTVAEKGQWSRLYISDSLRRPIREVNSSNFPSLTFTRNELLGHNENNPVRIELYGVRRGNTLLTLGFMQVTLSDLAIRKKLDWVQTEYSYVSPEVKVVQHSKSENMTEVRLLLGRPLVRSVAGGTGPMDQTFWRHSARATSSDSDFLNSSVRESFLDHPLLSVNSSWSKSNLKSTRTSIRFPSDYEDEENDEPMKWNGKKLTKYENSLPRVDQGSTVSW